MADERTKRQVYDLSHRTRFRFFMDRAGNDITRFRMQLEYRLDDGHEWFQVVGSDHQGGTARMPLP